MNDTKTRTIWVAYGTNGVVGSIRGSDDEFAVVMAGADAELGTYPSLESAKGALHANMPAGAGWPRYQKH